MIQKDQLRPYLGAYINLARHNLFTTLKFINISIGSKGGIDDNEAQIYKLSVLSQHLSPEQEMRAKRLFFLHFPFLKYMSSEKEDLAISFDRMRKSIRAFANVLSWWRNIYSHSRAKEDTGKTDLDKYHNYEYLRKDEKTICLFLELVMTVSARIIKERYSAKNEAQKGMLAADSMEFITKDRYKPSRTADGKRTMVLSEGHFSYPKQKGTALRDGSNPDRLSVFGKIQMICLFLEKKYITEFLSQIQFLSDFNGDAQAPLLSQRRLVLETMSALRIRLPESRLQSDKDEIQVALDILGELKKCPAEIYELLSAKDKSEFSVQSSTGETVLLRRSADRFVPLALSFLDTTKVFEKLRFQVNAGVFRYLYNENKSCVDGNTRIRVLQEPLNGFGRIQEVEKKRSAQNRDIWKEFKILGFEDTPRNDSACLPYISDVYTRYVIDGDNIGMRLDGDYLPEIKPREGGKRYDVPCRQADCTLSRFNLPALLFYHLLRPVSKLKSTKSVETIIEEAVGSYRRFFSDIAEGRLKPISDMGMKESYITGITNTYGISIKDIPDKIRDYLLKETDNPGRFEKHKNALICELKEETKHRLEVIKEQKRTIENDFDPEIRSDNKPGKRGYVQIKPGNMASYLAKDIVFFQEGTVKLTGLNYAVMQSVMATFSPSKPDAKKELMKVFKKAGLIAPDGSAGTHPFLFKAMSGQLVSRTIDLYIEYLNAKIQFLSGTIADNAPFLHSERVRWAQRNESYYKDLAKRYSEQPIALTGSIFEKPVREILLSFKNPDVTAELNSKHCNMAYMIQLYQAFILDDGPQCFYGLSEGDMEHDSNYRLYSLVRKYRQEANRIRGELQPNSVFDKTLRDVISWVNKHPEETIQGHQQPNPSYVIIRNKIRSAYNNMTDTERLIRRLATQDTVLFMAVAALLKKVLGFSQSDNDWKQYQIGRSDEPGILDRRLPRVVKNVRFDWKDSTNNEAPASHKQVAVEAKDICIKDYGDIYRLINDRRVASLVHHLNIDSVKTDDLRKELENYDNRRVGVFKDLFEYENRVMDSTDTTPDSPDFNDVQNLDTSLSPEEKLSSKIIRNGFCHNFYPTKIGKNKEVAGVVIYEEDIPEVADCMAKKISNLNRKKLK